jgi:hypothetical protein
MSKPTCERIVIAAFGVADATLAQEIAKGTLHPGTVLATLLIFRESLGLMSPELAARLVMPMCEGAAEKGAA